MNITKEERVSLVEAMDMIQDARNKISEINHAMCIYKRWRGQADISFFEAEVNDIIGKFDWMRHA